MSSSTHQPPFKKQDQEAPGHEHQMDPKPDYGYEDYKGSGKLANKIALVTGSDSGIGRAIALAFAREGAHVAIAYWKEDEDAKHTQKVVEEAGVESLLCRGDLSKDDTCREVIDKVVGKWGRLDVLVNNAAYQDELAEKFEEISRERLDRTFDTNIKAYFRLAQLAVPHMQKGSAIINIASVQAYKPNPGILDYASTKGAIVTFTKGLAPHLMERGIRVNSIAPGPVWTPLIVESFPEEKVEQFGKGSPPGRPAQPKEFGPPAVFLACEKDSSYIAGAILPVTGGTPIN